MRLERQTGARRAVVEAGSGRSGRHVRTWTAGLCAVGLLLAGVVGAWAQATGRAGAGSTSEAPPAEQKTLRASDGWPIAVTYLPSPMGKDGAVVVLLHMKGSSSLVWLRGNGGFAKTLQGAGYAVVAVDLRKHGKSRPAGTGRRRRSARSADQLLRVDYQAMVSRDLEAVKGFLYAEHQQQHLNMRKLAIVAAEFSCPIAINYTALDWSKPPYDDAPTPEARTPRGQDVQALVLLSPDLSCPGVTTVKALRMLRNLPVSVLICVGAEDEKYVENAQQLYRLLGGSHRKVKRVYVNKLPGKLRGTDMLAKPQLGVQKLILKFLDDRVKSLSGPRYDWRDRRSRLLK